MELAEWQYRKYCTSEAKKALVGITSDFVFLFCMVFFQGDTGRTETFTSEQLENVVLYTLRARYRMEQVYTWVDRVLVGVNPVVPLPIYTPDHMQAYNKSREQTPVYVKPSAGDARLASCVCAERTALYAGCRRRRMGFVVVALARGSQRRQ